MVDRDDFLLAMSGIAGTIHIIATVEEGLPIGVVATSVCSLSADPPSLVVCLNKTTSAHDPILRQKFFSVSALSASQADVARKFMSEKGAKRFDHPQWQIEPGRIPMLQSGLASFRCELASSCDGYSHSILIGRVVDLDRTPSRTDEGCLIWHQRTFARPEIIV